MINGVEGQKTPMKISEISLTEVLVEGVQRTKAMGTSTFVMASIDESSQTVSAINLGDSAFMIVRADPNEETGF